MQVKKITPLAPVKTAKVKFTKGVVLGPGQIATEGDIYEVPKHLASQFVGSGQAKYTDEGEESEHDDAGAATHEAGYSTVTAEKPDTRDPKPKKKN